MMRVDVDLERCEGHGECVMRAPEVFELDDDDRLHYSANPDVASWSGVERAVAACPVQAIRIVA